MKFLSGLGRLFDRVNTAMVAISTVLILGLTFIVGADITLRYVFLRPLGWVKEISEYILVALGFLVAAWVLKEDSHVKMDLLLNKVSPRGRAMMNLITSIISAVIVLIVTCFSLRVMVDFHRTRLVTPSVLEPPKWVLLIPIFVGSLLLFIQLIRRTFSFIDLWKELRRKGPRR